MFTIETTELRKDSKKSASRKAPQLPRTFKASHPLPPSFLSFHHIFSRTFMLVPHSLLPPPPPHNLIVSYIYVNSYKKSSRIMCKFRKISVIWFRLNFCCFLRVMDDRGFCTHCHFAFNIFLLSFLLLLLLI